MQPTRQEYILKSEVIKIAEKLIEKIKDADEANDGFLPHYRTYPTASIKELLSELDNLSGVSGWIPETKQISPDIQAIVDKKSYNLI